MFSNMALKDKLEELRKNLGTTLTEEDDYTSTGVLKKSNELDEYILLFIKSDKKAVDK